VHNKENIDGREELKGNYFQHFIWSLNEKYDEFSSYLSFLTNLQESIKMFSQNLENIKIFVLSNFLFVKRSPVPHRILI